MRKKKLIPTVTKMIKTDEKIRKSENHLKKNKQKTILCEKK